MKPVSIFYKEIELIKKHDLEKEFRNLVENLREKKYTMQDIEGFTTRNYATWEKAGVLFGSDNIHKKKYFDLGELLWINIVKQLRAFNYPLPLIKCVHELVVKSLSVKDLIDIPGMREDLLEYFSNWDFGVPTEKILQKSFMMEYRLSTSTLDIVLAFILMFQSEVTLLVFIDEDYPVIMMNEASLDLNWETNTSYREIRRTPHISISVAEILSRAILDVKPKRFNSEIMVALTEEERFILDKCQQQQIKSATIYFDGNGKTDRIELAEALATDDSKRIAEFIIAGGYHNIEFKTQDGVIVECIRTTKYKFIDGTE